MSASPASPSSPSDRQQQRCIDILDEAETLVRSMVTTIEEQAQVLRIPTRKGLSRRRTSEMEPMDR